MKRYLLGVMATIGLWANMASAQSVVEQVVDQLAEQGYTDIEVRRTERAVHVEALKDGVEYEYLYDEVTGEILEQGTRPVGEKESDKGLDDADDRLQGGGFDRGQDGNHGHGNSGGYDQDNPGRSHDDSVRGPGRSERGKDGSRGRDKRGDNAARGRGNGN